MQLSYSAKQQGFIYQIVDEGRLGRFQFSFEVDDDGDDSLHAVLFHDLGKKKD